MTAPALTAPEFKYTDRHVREDVRLRELAETYVTLYGGDFEPLLNAKYELARMGRLETRTARVVLNCMRYDATVADQLPAPRPLSLAEWAQEKKAPEPFCLDPRPHSAHSEWRGKKYLRCDGVPWPINRVPFETVVTVKPRYAAAHQSATYHLTSGDGWILWNPPWHEMGPARPAHLHVDLVCRYPSILVDPLLFHEEPTHLVSTIKRNPGPRTLCRHCAAVRS